MRFIMQSNALKPFKKESKRIIRCRNQKENKTSFQIMDKTRNKTGTLCKIYATHFFVTGYEKGKRNGLFRPHEPVKCVIEPLKWRWFALCGKSINNDLIDNDKIRAKFYGK